MNEKIFCKRSDLACECAEMVYGSNIPDDDGIVTEQDEVGGIKIERMEIRSERGSEKIGKPCGRYVTLTSKKLSSLSSSGLSELCGACASELTKLIPAEGKSCLVACLGNRGITADSQGPICAERILVTRHIKNECPRLFSELGLFDTSCTVPGVLGSTGIEAASIVRGIVDKAHPDFVIAVDSLASGRLDRVGSTVQITDTGISPGSGIGNRRAALDSNTLGVPVIGMGIPTVVDAVTVSLDILEEAMAKSGETPSVAFEEILEKVLSCGSFGHFVTPKDTDKISRCAGIILAMSINKALNPVLEEGEICELVRG